MAPKRTKPLPDRWDFDKWRNGRRVQPPRGHKVEIYWGDLLKLEYFLRNAEENLRITSQEVDQLEEHLGPEDKGGYGFYLALARDVVRNTEFILATLRRTGKVPNSDHPDWPLQQVSYAGDRPSVAEDPDEGPQCGVRRDMKGDIPF